MDQKTAQRLQGEMNDEVKKIQDSQKRLSSLLSQRGKLLAQQNENEMVEKELAVGRGGDVEEGEAVVWKLVGPVLVKVEVEEARSNVDQPTQVVQGGNVTATTTHTHIQRAAKQQLSLLTQHEERTTPYGIHNPHSV